MPPINASVTNQQITASVGETQIDVAVSGGVGPTGTAGAAATVAVGTVTTGAPGSSASVVNAGSSSAAVLNFTIPAGAAGAAGATGPQGPAGAAGQAATVSIGTVTTGAAGASASVTNVGSSSAAVLNFTIPAGAAGAAGAQGIQGVAGPAGAAGQAATVAVGTVTTGAAGSSASVTNVGSSSAAVFNFTIPAGAAGAAGATGPQGPAGPAGTTSWNGITDKPATFAPSSHTHTASAITDFTTAAASAAPVQSVAGKTGTVLLSSSDISGLATVATSGSYADLSNKPAIPAAYSLPTATASVLGGVKIGSGISIDANGVISASSAYTLPAATTSSLGGVIVGSGLSVSSGTISAAVTSVNGLTGAVVVIATYATADSFPATGNAATLYVESDTGRVYQWAGSVYAETGIDSAAGQHASQHGAAGSDPITIATSQITGFNAAAAAAAPVQSVNGATGAVTVSAGKPLGLILALT